MPSASTHLARLPVRATTDLQEMDLCAKTSTNAKKTHVLSTLSVLTMTDPIHAPAGQGSKEMAKYVSTLTSVSRVLTTAIRKQNAQICQEGSVANAEPDTLEMVCNVLTSMNVRTEAMSVLKTQIV